MLVPNRSCLFHPTVELTGKVVAYLAFAELLCRSADNRVATENPGRVCAATYRRMVDHRFSSLDDLTCLASWAGTSQISWWCIVLMIYRAAAWMWVRNERAQLWEIMVDILRYHTSDEEVLRACAWRPPAPSELGRRCLGGPR